MADSDKEKGPKKLKLKKTPVDESAENTPNSPDEKAQETAAVHDPLAARDAQSVDKLKRVRAESAPHMTQALTESGRLGPPGSDTVSLKVVRDERKKSGDSQAGTGDTIRLRPSDNPPSKAEDKTAEEDTNANDTLRASDIVAEGEAATHTATLRVARHPAHPKREQDNPAGDTGAAPPDAEATSKVKPKSKTSTETLQVARSKEAQPSSDNSAEQTQPVQPKPQAEGTNTATLKVTKRSEAEKPSETPPPQNETENTHNTSAETQLASAPAQGRTSTAQLDKVKPKKAKTTDGSAEDTIHIKPPSKVNAFQGQTEKGEEGNAKPGGSGKGTGKITLKMKKRTAQKTVSLGDSEPTETVAVPPEQPDKTAQLEDNKGKRALRLKTDAPAQADAPSAEAVGEALGEEATQEKQKAEPGAFLTLLAAASIVGVGVALFFLAYQYLSLFTTTL